MEEFALKGGTAINLFHNDLPRLSVDIDLTYLPMLHDRETALHGIANALDNLKQILEEVIEGLSVNPPPVAVMTSFSADSTVPEI